MYGITKEIRKYALSKIKKQKEYLNTNYFQVGSDKIKMSELVKNAFINSDKYIAEVNHRVYSLYNYANNKGLKNIFGTITLPSEYHQKIKNKKNNPKYANKHIDTIYDIKTQKPSFENIKFENYTPNAGAKELSQIFKKMLDLRILRNIDKEEKCYFRVYEPHKDGTPHLHFSLFVPSHLVDEVATKLKTYFSKRFGKHMAKIETEINNPIAYLMKYILKTFDDLREDENNISDLSLWYIANKITRFYTSRTLISLEVYRKLNGRYNLLELTQMLKDREISILVDIDTNKVVSVYDKIGKIYEKRYTEVKKVDSTFKLKYKKKYQEPPVVIDGVTYVMSHGQLKEFEPIVPVCHMTLNALYQDYIQMNHADTDSFDLNHYGLVKNELIKRDVINGEILPINLYNHRYFYG